MRSRPLLGLGIVLAAVAALGSAELARGDDEHSGNSQAPSYFLYPNGRNLAQTFAKPAEDTENLGGAAEAAPGMASSRASASLVASQPSLQDLGLVPLPSDSTQIQLAAPGGEENLAEAVPRSLHRFSYGLQHKGVPLAKFSSVSHVVQVQGAEPRTIYVRSTNLPKAGMLPESTRATVKAEDAATLGQNDAKQVRAELQSRVTRPRREIFVAMDGSAQLTWSFMVESTDPTQMFTRAYWVSAQGGEPKIVHREDQIYFVGQEPATQEADTQKDVIPEVGAVPIPIQMGRVTGNIWGLRRSPLDPPNKKVPLRDYTAATKGTTKFITNPNGVYMFLPGATLSQKLVGPFAVVANQAGAALAPIKTGNNMYFDANTEPELAQVSAFFWVCFTHEFAKPYLPGNPTSLLNNPVRVNINQTCNAFWSSGDHSLNFFRSGGGCVNSAYCDVACHEFGHGIDFQFGGIRDGGYSEGFGDSVAILITRDSIIGRDFKGKNNHLRNAKDVVTWPPANPEVHQVGRIYNGFTWELTQQLLSKYTSDEPKAWAVAKDLILGAGALNPKDIPDAVRLSFFVDSKTGSKHFYELAAAADSRKIPRPPQPITEEDAIAALAAEY